MSDPFVDQLAAGPVAQPPAAPGGLVGRAARAALGIAVLTAASRLFGFGRTLVFARTVGATCLGDTYVTSNTVPNIVFEVVAGGALASLVVPVLAAPIARGDRDEVSRTASALLTWAVVVTIPVIGAGLLLARPIVGLLIGSGTPSGSAVGCDRHTVLVVGTRMLLIFMPQVLFYGLCVVLTGVLQAHRRFLAPAISPLVSSVVVIAAYLLFAGTHQGIDLAGVSVGSQALLSVGTTLGVVAMVVPLLVPASGLGLRLRPRLRFPHAVGSRVARLAVAGVATLAAQQLSVAVVLRLAHGAAGGTLVLYNLAWAVFLVPWAVLAVPVATTVFPRLSARAAGGDDVGYAAIAATSTRVVLAVTATAAAALVAAAVPLGRVLALRAPGNADTVALAWAMAAFAPGLIGYGLVAHLGRALYARGSWRAPALSICAGWLAVIVADVLLVHAFSPRFRVAALALGNSAGMTVAGVLLLIAIRRAAGVAALAGVGRLGLAGFPGVLVGVAIGVPVSMLARHSGVTVGVGVGVLAAAVGIAGCLLVLWAGQPAAARGALIAQARRWRRRKISFTMAQPEVKTYAIVLALATSSGGVGRHVSSLASGLRSTGNSVVVVAPAATEELFRFSRAGRFEPLEIGERPRPGHDALAAWRLRRRLGATDIVHAHGVRAGAVAALALTIRRSPRPVLVVTFHNTILGSVRRRRAGRLIQRWVVRRSDVVLAVSADLEADLRADRRGDRPPVRRALVAAPGAVTSTVAADPSAEVRRALGIELGDRLVLAVGRLHPQKGFDDLIAAAGRLAADGMEAVFAIAGDGPARAELATAARDSQADVRLLGHRDDVPALIAAADLVVMPSRWEGWPLAAGQALGAGRPFVATSVGGLPELVGDGALLVPSDDPAALAAAISRVLSEPALAGQLSLAARRRAADLPTDADVIAAVLASYRVALAGRE
jgi:putative peptidoglycan lipid II flippase